MTITDILTARTVALIALMGLLQSVNGCATASEREKSRMADAIVAGHNSVEKGVSLGLSSTSSNFYRGVFVRRNRTPRCPSPNYELYIYGGWQRVALRARGAASKILANAIEQGTPITISKRQGQRKVGGLIYPLYTVLGAQSILKQTPDTRTGETPTSPSSKTQQTDLKPLSPNR